MYELVMQADFAWSLRAILSMPLGKCYEDVKKIAHGDAVI